MSSLDSLQCVPCRIGAPILAQKEIETYLKEVNNWLYQKAPDKIVKEFEFKDFNKALNFVNKVGELAEKQGHHPNIYLHSYKKVKVELWTHKIGGLHRNDFIMAANVDKL